ncbi:hypothetical protein [Nostoc sp. UHCC 0252]|uniref:hypothetical protein n=1 Tax=Nostoc sp. UHCC 0252 TaxID=3110241 RepID=UPI002B1EE687|nr:hypothetical protein [Nostoc sp. UHCC 0252]MEA5605868.1 hypothetical protein [Nostoc sp. UHCC 0252]
MKLLQVNDFNSINFYLVLRQNGREAIAHFGIFEKIAAGIMKNLQVVEKEFSSVPIIDISTLVSRKGNLYSVASQIKQACRGWDNANIHDFRGTYGDYVLNKVSKVFPELRRAVL